MGFMHINTALLFKKRTEYVQELFICWAGLDSVYITCTENNLL